MMQTLHSLPCILLLSLFIALPATAREPESPGEGLRLVPELSIKPRISIARYRASNCSCFDRNLWHGAAALGARWHRHFEVDVEYRYGGIWAPASGYIPIQGVGAGITAHLTPDSPRWWSGLYGRAGFLRWSVPRTRQGVFPGLYGALGYGLPILGGRVHLNHEIPLSYVGGSLSHWTIGAAASIRVVLLK